MISRIRRRTSAWSSTMSAPICSTGRAYRPSPHEEDRALECYVRMSLVSTLTLPARMTLRALDDLHVLAQTAATLNDVEARMTRPLDVLEGHAERMVELAERVTGQMDAGVDAAQ